MHKCETRRLSAQLSQRMILLGLVDPLLRFQEIHEVLDLGLIIDVMRRFL
jgi:hypothetical protein